MSIVAASIVAVVSGASDARAQQANAPAAKETIKATHGDWQIRCQVIPVPKQQAGKGDKKGAKPQFENVEQCGMVQVITDSKNKNVKINVAVLKAKRDGKVLSEMRVVAPLGVFLPTGIAFEVDGNPIGRTGFIQCQRNGCLAIVQVNEELLGKLKKGTKGNFIIYRGPGLGIGMGLSLAGFSKAYEVM